MNNCKFAYLAGAMDSDGYFTIRRSSYHKRIRGDATNFVYSEKVGLKQTEPIIPRLLCDAFGGSFYMQKPQTENSKPLYTWIATDKKAVAVCRSLLPFLQVKARQAETLLELRESKNGKYSQASYWFLQKFPDWQSMELVTSCYVFEKLGYTHKSSVSQAIRNKTLIALPYDNSGDASKPRFPKLLVDYIAEYRPDGRPVRPPELIEWRERLYQAVKEMNKIGINGTPVFHRTGCFECID